MMLEHNIPPSPVSSERAMFDEALTNSGTAVGSRCVICYA